MKVYELTGIDLDYWIAKAEGYAPEIWRDGCYRLRENGDVVAYLGDITCLLTRYSPSTNWSQGGPIIEREGIELKKDLRHLNVARIAGFEPDLTMPGHTPLVAAMRAYVASKYGGEVDDS